MVVFLVAVFVVSGVWLLFPRRPFWALAVILWAAGFFSGGALKIEREQAFLLTCVGLVLAWASRQFAGAFRSFTRLFVQAVYRDFVVLTTSDRRSMAGKD